MSVDQLDEEALERILTEPKNAITKQYRKLLSMDGVELEFSPEAIKKTAQLAVERDTGARGLRSILEKTMTKLMFDVPSDKSITKVTITDRYITGEDKEPLIERGRPDPLPEADRTEQTKALS